MSSESQPAGGAAAAIPQGRHSSTVLSDAHSLAKTLRTWFEANGGWLNPDVDIVYDGSCGFHARASKSLGAPVIAKCPAQLTLSYLNLDRSQTRVPHVDTPLQSFLGQIPNHVLTYLLLIELRQRFFDKQASLWEPYIACLPGPESMTTPIWFTDEDMAFLHGTNLAQAAVTTRERWNAEWEHAIDTMEKSGHDKARVYSFEMFCWAATIISSRAFSSDRILPDFEKSPILFPVIDILNHSTKARVDWNFSSYDNFTLASREEFSTGEELFNNYAPKQNDELLLGYGFAIPENPSEQFAVKVALPPHQEQHYLRMDAFNAKYVPFGMSAASLQEDREQNQGFIRTPGNPFGRYDCSLPFLRGIPPYVVHLNFLATLNSLGIELDAIEPARPPARVFIKTILGLYQAVRSKSERLPLRKIDLFTLANDKQRFAAIYRDGQAKVIYEILKELEAPIMKRRVRDQVPGFHPVIMTTTEALLAFERDFPAQYALFETGLADVWQISRSAYTEQTCKLGEEDTVWMLLLFAFATIMLGSDDSDSIIFSWMRNLFEYYPLVDSGPSQDPEHAPSFDYLAQLVPYFVDESADRDELNGCQLDLHANQLFNVKGRVAKVGDSVIMWAVKAALGEVFVLPDLARPMMPRECMYFQPWREHRCDEWMLEDMS